MMSLPKRKIAILSPVFNDWESAAILLSELDPILYSTGDQFEVFFVDDGSTLSIAELAPRTSGYLSFQQISIIELGRNLGHQRAIAIGLSHLSQFDFDSVLILDSDGEDSPNDVPRLIDAHFQSPQRPLVFAKRTRRSENLFFRIGYAIYKFLFRILTSRKIFFGNFSIVSMADIRRLVLHSELWNHYPATVLKARIKWIFVDTARAKRYKGESRMTGWPSFVLHGLSAISVYLDDVGVRLIVASLLMLGIGALGFYTIVYIRLFTDSAIPGWSALFGLSFISVAFQAFMGSILLSFSILNNRTNVVHTPLHHAKQFILRVTLLWKK